MHMRSAMQTRFPAFQAAKKGKERKGEGGDCGPKVNENDEVDDISGSHASRHQGKK